MSDDEFQVFLDESLDELSEKQERLKSEYGLATFDRWHFDQETEHLQFFNAQGHLMLEADVIDIGSYASNSNTWKWAWSNDSVLPSLRLKAEPLKQLGTVTGYEIFTSDSAVSVEDESMAWELAALSVRQLGARGAYKAPSSTRPLVSFLAITSVRRVQS